MDKGSQRIAGGKQNSFGPLENGSGLDNLAIYLTTAGGWHLPPSGTKQNDITRNDGMKVTDELASTQNPGRALSVMCKAYQYNRVLLLMLSALAEQETDDRKKYDLLAAASFVTEANDWLNLQIQAVSKSNRATEDHADSPSETSTRYH